MKNEKKCDACGEELKGGYSLGGTLLCRKCEPDVMAEIEMIRSQGKQVNAMGIARRLYREKFDTSNYILRDIPANMMQEMKEKALREKGSVRDLIFVAVAQYLAKK